LERSTKGQKSTNIKAAINYLFRDRKPITIQSDKGTKFVNTTVRRYLKSQDVNFNTTHNPIIERFNRTLKTKMFKYFTKNNTYRYSDVLHKLEQFTTILFIPREAYNPVR